MNYFKTIRNQSDRNITVGILMRKGFRGSLSEDYGTVWTAALAPGGEQRVELPTEANDGLVPFVNGLVITSDHAHTVTYRVAAVSNSFDNLLNRNDSIDIKAVPEHDLLGRNVGAT